MDKNCNATLVGPPFPSNWPGVSDDLLLKILRKIRLDAFEF